MNDFCEIHFGFYAEVYAHLNKNISVFSIHFSIIFEWVVKIEIGLLTLSFSPVLKIGFTFAFLNAHRKIPDSMLLLIIYSPAEPSVDLDLEYIENVFTYLES